MADNTLGIGGTRITGGVDVLKDVLGLTTPRGSAAGGGSAASARHSPFGARGQRMLPPDYPLEALDKNAARGTYLDILV